MNRKWIAVLLVGLAGIMVVLVWLEIQGNRTEKRPDNPYELSLDPFSQVDSALIRYEEVLNLTLNETEKKGIAWGLGAIWIIGVDFVQSIHPEGKILLKKELDATPTALTLLGSTLFIAFSDHIRVLDSLANETARWAQAGDSTLITSLAANDRYVYAADAGKRRVLKYDREGTLLDSFDGKRETSDLHGFILPSPYFDLTITPDGELWVVNPGLHAFENYTPEGRLRGYWNKSSADIDGFSGCCGPAQMASMPDGSFVTAEKGLVRIKIHRASGELESVVAPPALFAGGTLAPDLAVGDEGEIYALDFDRKMIRVFKRR